MRLHSLEITAFGAFGGTERVDFDELGSDGLFLLHGQTGAGKTTVLDAVAYALYGTVPGARQTGKRLHSDHAPKDVRPEVVLEATIGGRELRLTRSPEFRRPKLRGEGFTDQPARGTLEWLDGSGENLSRINDIGAEIVRLLGMSAEQFFQVVLLPQGEFAKFLKADTKDRAALLEKLFGTSRFKSVEEWFAERRRRSAEGLALQRQSIEVGLAGLAAAAGTESFEPTDEQPAALGWAGALVAECDARVAESETALIAARAQSMSAAEQLSRVQAQMRAQKRADEATAQLAAYAAAAGERGLLVSEAEEAERAERVEWANGALIAATESRDGLRGQVAALESDLTSDATSVSTLTAARDTDGVLDRGALSRSVRDWDTELALLEQARELEASLTRDGAALAKVGEEIAELSGVAERKTAQLASVPGQLDELVAQVAAAEVARSEVPGLKVALDEALAAADAAGLLITAKAEREKRSTTVQTAVGRLQEARETALDLRERRLNGMAAELAGGLVDGESCAVCGSIEHPAPAVSAENVVTKEAEESAQEGVAKAADALEVSRAALRESDGDVDRYTERSGGLDLEAATEARAKARTAFVEASALADTLDGLVSRANGLRAKQDELGDLLAVVARDSAVAEERRGQLELKVADATTKLADVIGGDASVAERAGRLTGARDRVAALADLLGQADAAVEAAAKAQALVDEAVELAGFDSLESAIGAVRTTQRRKEIAQTLAAASEGSASARAVLAEAEVMAVAELAPVSADEPETEMRLATEALEGALRTHEHAEGRRAGVAAQFDGLKAAVGKLAPIETRHEKLASLADLMVGGGANLRKMSLGTYVLAARLEEVATVASRRLRVMSGGRFEFVHSDGKVNREVRGGLALNILDANTGSERPTSTLSGGETFMASLSLALGLADVVAEEAGGIQLETLFIDEGFGTLDAEALDLVMGVLDELRAGGRSVGIVSHVAEMRHRIPSRLFVKKGDSGSTLHMTEG